MAKKGKILVVDDNAGIRTALKFLLPLYFESVELIASPKELISKTKYFKPDVILLDMNFHTDINTGNEGLYWLSELKSTFTDIEVVLFTAYADIALAVEGMKRGAFDFVVKPWENNKLIEILSNACDSYRKNIKKDNSSLEKHSKATEPKMFWGKSKTMTQLRSDVNKIAATDATVLITGENGTGKDVLAREIHRLSLRSNLPMVSVDVGAIPETLFESELFGHVKGAFTDAHDDRKGKFEIANSSTLFLDEIGNIPIYLQAKLLRVLQNRAVTKLGDTKSTPLDIRLICATNKNLTHLVEEGRFREDLYYRINTLHLHLPPLRERKDEIEALSEIFINRYATKYRRNISGISQKALQLLKDCYWKGNIRELQNCIEKAVILSEHNLLQDTDLQITSEENESYAKNIEAQPTDTLENLEIKAIKEYMKLYNGNLSMVAKSLNISRPTLYSKLKKYGI